LIDRKLSILTLHDVNPSCSEKLQNITDQLDRLNINYNLSIVPNYRRKYDLKENADFCNQVSTLLQSDHVELYMVYIIK